MLPKLVLLPGMDGSGEMFRDFVNALPKDFETESVLYPNNVAHGYAALMRYVQEAVPKDAPFVLVAESFSVPLAILLAATQPRNLKGIVLCAGFATSPVRGWMRSVGLWVLPVFLFAERVFGHVTLPEFMAEWLLLGSNPPKALAERLQVAVSWVKPRVMAKRIRSALTCDVLGALAQVNVPVLYVQATQDRLVSPDCLGEMQLVKPEKTVAIFGPHMMLQRQAELSAQVVVEFVRELTGRREAAAA